MSCGLVGSVHVFTCFLDRRESGSKPVTLVFKVLTPEQSPHLKLLFCPGTKS